MAGKKRGGPGKSRTGAGRPADFVPPGRDAGVYESRVQPLPRGGARSGWISTVALGLRPGGRSLSPDPRDGWAPDQPGDSGRIDAFDKIDRRRAAYRRQTVRKGERTCADARAVAGRGRPERREGGSDPDAG